MKSKQAKPDAAAGDAEPAKPVSFRLAPELGRALAAEAAARGESRGDCARRLVAAALGAARGDADAGDGADGGGGPLSRHLQEIGAQLSHLRTAVRDASGQSAREAEEVAKRVASAERLCGELRSDLATLAVALLSTSGGQNPKDAEEWVRREFCAARRGEGRGT